MRAYLGGHVGPLYVRSGSLARRRPDRRPANVWTWLALFPLMLMWWTARLMWWTAVQAWNAGVRVARRR